MRASAIFFFSIAALFTITAVNKVAKSEGRPAVADHLPMYYVSSFIIPLVCIIIGLSLWQKSVQTRDRPISQDLTNPAAKSAIKILLVIAGIGLILWGCLEVAGTVVAWIDESPGYPGVGSITNLVLIGILPIVGGLHFCRRGFSKN